MPYHRRRVTKGPAEITLHVVLGREIDLLKQLGGDGDGSGSANLPQSGIGIVVVVVQVGVSSICSWVVRVYGASEL